MHDASMSHWPFQVFSVCYAPLKLVLLRSLRQKRLIVHSSRDGTRQTARHFVRIKVATSRQATQTLVG